MSLRTIYLLVLVFDSFNSCLSRCLAQYKVQEGIGTKALLIPARTPSLK
jgi:hypothetical protein